MKRGWNFFAGLTAGFLLAVALTVGAFYLNLGVPTNAISKWTLEINEKKRLLAQHTASPKLLLVGGSSTLFGLSAQEIEALTGWRTLNLGTHAALGLTYILHDAQQLARPGDAILLIPEYELYTYGKVEPPWADALMLDYLIAEDPAYLRSLSVPEQCSVVMMTSYARLVRGLKARWRHSIPQFDHPVYNVRSINEWGDQTGHAPAARPPEAAKGVRGKSALSSRLPSQPKGFPVLETFCHWARTNHIRVLATFPNVSDQPEYHSPEARQDIQRIKDFFACLGVPVVGEYTESILPYDQFFDTPYHLTDAAAVARTRRLAAELKPVLGP
jgi:hypothetical protein